MAAPLRQLRGASAALHVYISNPELLRTLRDFLESADCVAEESRPHYLDVHLPKAISDAQAYRELDIYLATWQALNPGVETYVVDTDDAP